jgi:predicted extracellular nuclease
MRQSGVERGGCSTLLVPSSLGCTKNATFARKECPFLPLRNWNWSKNENKADNKIQDILSKDKNARIVTAGDFNEFAFVQPLEEYTKISGLKDMDEVVNIDKVERYTYLFDMNAQELDHMFVSPSLAKKSKADFEHIHVNTWPKFDAQVSDHDPSVARLDVCA